MTIKYKCKKCERVVESDSKSSIFSPLTCSECNGKFKQVDESTPLSEGNSEEEEEYESEEEEDEEEELDTVICPHCNQEIDEVIQKSLKINEGSCELASCSKCNKILGVIEFS